MNIIILAGGFGTRLKSVLGNVPKPIAPVDGKPFLYYILKNIEKYDVQKVCLSLFYGADQISGALKHDTFQFEVSYAIEPSALGTGGAIYYAMQQAGFDEAIVVNGDTFFDINLVDFWNFYRIKKCDIALAARQVDDAGRYGALTINDEKVTASNEKNHDGAGIINGGIYALNVSIFNDKEAEHSFSFEHFLKENVGKLNIMAKQYDVPFIDIGVPEDYMRAEGVLLLKGNMIK